MERPMTNTRDPLLRAALAEWRRLAPHAGLDASAYVPEPLGRRHTRRAARIVIRMQACDRADVVFKRAFRPADDPAWVRGLETLGRTRELLAQDARPAPVLIADKARQSAILGWTPGRSLCEHLLLKLDQPARRAALMTRAGGWLAAFHAATDAGQVAFDVAPYHRRIARLVARAKVDPTTIADADFFVMLAERLPQFAHLAEKAPVRRAALHGDLTARNLVLSPGRATAIDFCAARTGPVLPEIARLLSDIETRFGDPEGDGTSPDTEAFEAGYGAKICRDPVFAYLLRVQVMADWARLGEQGDAASPFAASRMARLQALAQGLMRPAAA
jgi:hypothetical protein